MQGTTDRARDPNEAPDELELPGVLLARLRAATSAASDRQELEHVEGVARMIDVARRLAGTRGDWR